MSLAAGPHGAHAGGALSMVEILSVLYLDVMRYDVKNPLWEERDRFILSKGHGAPSLYAALCLAGFLEEKELATFKANETRLYGHRPSTPASVSSSRAALYDQAMAELDAAETTPSTEPGSKRP